MKIEALGSLGMPDPAITPVAIQLKRGERQERWVVYKSTLEQCFNLVKTVFPEAENMRTVEEVERGVAEVDPAGYKLKGKIYSAHVEAPNTAFMLRVVRNNNTVEHWASLAVTEEGAVTIGKYHFSGAREICFVGRIKPDAPELKPLDPFDL
jgi:hypothetical protein